MILFGKPPYVSLAVALAAVPVPALAAACRWGVVNVMESKEQIMTAPVPYIVARGRKGGSSVAAAICNALLYQISQ